MRRAGAPRLAAGHRQRLAGRRRGAVGGGAVIGRGRHRVGRGRRPGSSNPAPAADGIIRHALLPLPRPPGAARPAAGGLLPAALAAGKAAQARLPGRELCRRGNLLAAVRCQPRRHLRGRTPCAAEPGLCHQQGRRRAGAGGQELPARGRGARRDQLPRRLRRRRPQAAGGHRLCQRPAGPLCPEAQRPGRQPGRQRAGLDLGAAVIHPGLDGQGGVRNHPGGRVLRPLLHADAAHAARGRTRPLRRAAPDRGATK
mmetsp:Transcript_6538/g.26964  ORF Transcript_6538/g.26964 Transcript_6538/m.26964 type:complete len:256 (+) Transcript_6538:434-1201(+)